MSKHDDPLSGLEPVLGQPNTSPALTGLEPELGGLRRVRPDPRLVAALIGPFDAREAAIRQVLDRGWARIYALELVKILSVQKVGRARRADGEPVYTDEQRITATLVLQRFGHDVSVAALVEALSDRAWWVGQYAMDALVATGPAAVLPVIGALQTGTAITRRRAADILGEIGDNRAFDALLAAARDPEGWVRARVAQALGLLRDRRAVPILQRMARDDDPVVVRNANEALRCISPPQSENRRLRPI